MEKAPVYQNDMMPDVTGMGARDAIYAIERRGVVTRILGRGKVISQSLAAGHHIARGDTCVLRLE
jgi:cell division protein FtsI (penicillin-binding protein 3)